MDGPSMEAGFSGGGGFVAGSASVLITADLSPLEAGLARAQSMVAGFAGQSFSVPVGGGAVAGGGGTFTAGVPAPAGGTSIGGAGLPTAGLPTAQGFAGFQGLPAAPSPSASGGGGFGGGGMGGAWWMRSGVRSFGIPFAALYGLEAAGHVAQGFEQYAYVAGHPEQQLREFTSPGSGLGLAGNPTIQQIASEAQGIDETLAFRQGISRIPLLGNYLNAFDVGSDSSFNLEMRRKRLAEQKAGISATAELNFQVAGLAARNAGDAGGIAQQGFARDISEAQERFDLARDAVGRGSGADLAGLVRAAHDAADALNGLKSQVDGAVSSIASQQAHRAAVMHAGTEVIKASTFGGRFDIRSAQIGQFKAELDAANLDYMHHPADEVRFQTAQQAHARFVSAQESYQSDFYSSQLNAISEFNNAYSANMAGAYDRQFQYGVSSRAAGFDRRASLLAGGRDFFGASIARINARREEATGLPALQAGFALAGLDADEASLRASHDFEMKVAGEGYDARIAAAGYAGNLQPLSAQATLSVARARHEVAMAPPEERAKAVAAAQAELRSQATLTTAQRGGEVGVSMSLYEAMGSMAAYGIDLTGRAADRYQSRNIFQNGANNVENSPQAKPAQTVSAPGVEKLVNDFFQWLKQKAGSGLWPN